MDSPDDNFFDLLLLSWNSKLFLSC